MQESEGHSRASPAKDFCLGLAPYCSLPLIPRLHPQKGHCSSSLWTRKDPAVGSQTWVQAPPLTIPHLPILKMRGKQIQPWSSIGSSRKCTERRRSKEKLLDVCLQAVFQRKPRNQVRKNPAKNQFCFFFFFKMLWTISVKSNLGDSRDSGLIPGSRRSPGVGNGYPLQCSCLIDRGAWWARVHGVAKASDKTERRTETLRDVFQTA